MAQSAFPKTLCFSVEPNSCHDFLEIAFCERVALLLNYGSGPSWLARLLTALTRSYLASQSTAAAISRWVYANFTQKNASSLHAALAIPQTETKITYNSTILIYTNHDFSTFFNQHRAQLKASLLRWMTFKLVGHTDANSSKMFRN